MKYTLHNIKKPRLKKWLRSAPPYILDVFNHGREGFTFLFSDGHAPSIGDGEAAINGWSEQNGWFWLLESEIIRYRKRSAKKRARWMDVPERLRITVIQTFELEP